MAITKTKKTDVVRRVEDALKDAGSVVFVGAKGLKVAEVSDLRRKLKGDGITYYVAKKTLVRRALASQQYDGQTPDLPGELALAWGADALTPAREIHSFAKTHKDQMKILGGIFEGRFMTATEMTDVALIPSRHTLYAMFVNVINSPIQKLAVALDQIATKKEA